jgi:phosphopantothenoylcysteine decarboxylase / phosphopantothenate---cysteine ligase
MIRDIQMDQLKGKEIILAVTGGIAAYKSVELLRLITGQGAGVRVVMTEAATKFVGPTTFEALSGKSVYRDMFGDDGVNAVIRHIDWATSADAVVVAPATANFIGKLSNGIADDALSTLMLAVTAPVLICPSMNTRMYESAPVQRNLSFLNEAGYHLVSPCKGELACGTTGAGRLPEPPEILDRLIQLLTPKDFLGKRVLVTAGPTQEPMDPVRFISNPSSGKMGYAIARAAEYRGASVTLVSGPTEIAVPYNVDVIRVQTAAQMAEAVLEAMESSDIIIKSAAVSDYRPRQVAPEKIKKHQDTLVLEMVKNPDILQAVGERKGSRFVVGFAAETQELEANALGKLKKKNLDMIVGNLVNVKDSGFATETNSVTIFYRNGDKENLPTMEKIEVAHALLDRILTRSVN